MNTRITLTLVGLLAGLALPGFCTTTWGALPQGEEESLTRVYDITTLNLPFYEDAQVETLRLAPYAPGELDYDDLAGEGYPIFCADMIENLLYTIVGEEQFEHEGISIGALDDEKLFVTGPESIHSIVSHVLALIDSHLNRKITIDVEIYKADKEAALENQDASTIRQAAEQGLLRLVLKQACCAVPGGLSEICTEKKRPIVLDYDNEIAQESIAYEPIISEISTGLSLSLRPFTAPDSDGLIVALHGLYSEIVNSPIKRDLRIKARVTTDAMMNEIRVSHTVDSPAMEFASLASVIPLEPGKTAVVRSAFPHQSGLGSLVILLTARSVQPVERLDLGNGLYLSSLDFDFLATENLLPVQFDRDGPFSEHNLLGHDPEWDSTLTSLGRRGRMVPRRMEDISNLMVEESVPPETEFDFGGDYFSFEDSRGFFLGNLVVMRARQDFCDRATGFARRMFAAGSESVNVDVRFIETTGPPVLTEADLILDSGRLVGALSIPMISGGRAASLAGLEGFMVYGYDVDVATGSSCPNPRIRRYLDGLFACLVHHPVLASTPGAGVIEAEFYINKLAGPMQTCNLGENGGMLGVIDQPEFDHGLLQTRFPLDNELHVIGTVVGERDGVATTIYVIAGSAES